ncbi:MAG: VTT domain-containing protein [Pseudomonadota bacterium]
MREFIQAHGFWAIAAGSTVQRGVTNLLGGVLAHAEPLSLWYTALAGFIGAVAADTACYAIGRWFSAGVSRWRFLDRGRETLAAFVSRFGPFAITLSQFLYGLRTVSMTMWGIQRTPFLRFLLFDMIGCALLVVPLNVVGYSLSTGAAAMLGRAPHLWGWLAVPLGVFLVAFYTCLIVIRRRLLRGMR